MNTVFLINEVVLFDPEMRSLSPFEGQPGSSVILHTPASECLLLLLQHNNEVLTQKFLFEQVWEKNGAVVTTNALYQNIASVRKGLKQVGLAENVIKTMPKIGFKSTAVLRQGLVSDFIGSVKVPEKAPESEDAVQPEPSVLTELPSLQVRAPAAEPASRLFSRWPYVLAGLLFCLSCGVLYLQWDRGTSFYEGYKYIGQVNGCKLYSSYTGVEKSTTIFTMLMKRYSLPCKPGKFVYMTINRLEVGTSLLMCTEQINSNLARCKSYIFKLEHYE